MAKGITIDRRFAGPPGIANGGYTAGVLARRVGLKAATVTLRRPVPLDEPLDVRETPDGAALWRGTELLGRCVPDTPDLGSLPIVSPAEAAARSMSADQIAERGLSGITCFVCGPGRADGLRIHAGPLPGAGAAAAGWTPSDDTLSEDGATVLTAVVWAALDCPGAWVEPETGTRAMLARFTATVLRPVRLGTSYAIVAVLGAVTERAFQVTTAVLNEAGEVTAGATAQWVHPRVG